MTKRAILFSLYLFIATFLLAACRQQNDAGIVGSVANNALKIMVNADSFYRVSLADLQKAGLTVERLDSSDLHLSQGDTAVPYTITADQLIFYGQAPTSRYTAARPYILRTGASGELMVETAVTGLAVVIVVDLPSASL